MKMTIEDKGIKKEITLTDEQIKSLGLESKGKMEVEQKYWYLSTFGEIDGVTWRNDKLDNNNLSIGNVFLNRESAEKHLAKLKAIQEVKTYIEEKFGEWTPDWTNDKQDKYLIYYSCFDHCFQVYFWVWRKKYSPFGYLRSKEHAEQLIKDKEQALKVIWDVE